MFFLYNVISLYYKKPIFFRFLLKIFIFITTNISLQKNDLLNINKKVYINDIILVY